MIAARLGQPTPGAEELARRVHLGADAVLLIPKIIGEDLGHFAGMAADLRMQPLVECFSREEINAASRLSDIIGINNRSFEDFLYWRDKFKLA